jgi:hypothetical protein
VLPDTAPSFQAEPNTWFNECGSLSGRRRTLLFGNDEIIINENSNIFNKVRAYIRQTKRF